MAQGRAASDGRKVVLIATDPRELALNEYDLNDANFLLETIRAILTKMLTNILKEQHIEQTLDFTIVRESRRDALGGNQSESPARRQRFQRVG